MKKKLIIVSSIIGLIILFIGLYYCIVKAGIPYQDPTPEMLEKYMRDMRIGEYLVIIGFCIELINIIIVITNSIIKKLKKC